MSLRFDWKVVMVLFVSLIFLSLEGVLALYPGYESVVIVPFGEVDIRLYVIALDDVGGYGVGNVTRTVEGAFFASRRNVTRCLIRGPPPEWEFGEIKININVTVINGWDGYKEIVETCSKAIIVNAHGETIPVPAGYSKENWVDKIAEAMLQRSVTWVHTAGYPFYYYHHQQSGEGEWGGEGFKRLMSHIGKNNVTCGFIYPWMEKDLIDIHIGAEQELGRDWSALANAVRVQIGKPLNGSQFKDRLVMSIWGVERGYITGAIIKFTNTFNTYNFGFYVHIGTYNTYDYKATSSNDPPTDSDYYRGLAGAAAAIWARAWHLAAQNAILDAEASIAKAENEGRTKGLDNAKQLLQNAKNILTAENGKLGDLLHQYYHIWASNSFGIVILRAYAARDAADNAVKPSFIEAHTLPLTILAIGTITTTVMALIWKRDSKKGSKTG